MLAQPTHADEAHVAATKLGATAVHTPAMKDGPPTSVLRKGRTSYDVPSAAACAVVVEMVVP